MLRDWYDGGKRVELELVRGDGFPAKKQQMKEAEAGKNRLPTYPRITLRFSSADIRFAPPIVMLFVVARSFVCYFVVPFCAR